MDLLIFIVLIGIVLFVFRSFKSFIYFIALVEILLRILSFVCTSIPVNEITSWIKNNIPNSIHTIINTYSTGILNQVLVWGLVICFIIFEYYTFRIFLKKK